MRYLGLDLGTKTLGISITDKNLSKIELALNKFPLEDNHFLSLTDFRFDFIENTDIIENYSLYKCVWNVSKNDIIFSQNNITYLLRKNKQLEVISLNEESLEINIPEEIDYLNDSYPVTSISSNAFHVKKARRIYLPKTIKYIAPNSFSCHPSVIILYKGKYKNIKPCLYDMFLENKGCPVIFNYDNDDTIILINGYLFIIRDKKAIFVNARSFDKKIQIPDEIYLGNKSFMVNEIAYGAFEGMNNLEKVIIPYTIQKVPSHLFNDKNNYSFYLEIENNELIPKEWENDWNNASIRIIDKSIITIKKDDLEFINGCEFSSKPHFDIPKARLHILGYDMDLANADLQNYIINKRKYTLYNIELQLNNLKKKKMLDNLTSSFF